jgi:hypothetical protein
MEMLSTLIITAIFCFAFFVGSIGSILGSIQNDITSKHIEKAQEICTNANSKISKMSENTVMCENGGEFKYEITK